MRRIREGISLSDPKDHLQQRDVKNESETKTLFVSQPLGQQIRVSYNLSPEEFEKSDTTPEPEILNGLSEINIAHLQSFVEIDMGLYKQDWLDSLLNSIDKLGAEETIIRYEDHVRKITEALNNTKFSGALKLPEVYSPIPTLVKKRPPRVYSNREQQILDTTLVFDRFDNS